MTVLQKTLIAVTLAALAGAGIYEARQVTQLRDQAQTLRQQREALAEQIQALQASLDDIKQRIATLLAENQQLKSNPPEKELVRLRNQLAQLEAKAVLASKAEPRETPTKALIAKREKLNQMVAQHPDKAIPEFRLLTEQQWLHAAIDAQFNNEEQINKALGGLRNAARQNFMSQMSDAVLQYTKNNRGKLPATPDEAQSYLPTPIDQAILDRWKISILNNDYFYFEEQNRSDFFSRPGFPIPKFDENGNEVPGVRNQAIIN